MAWDTERTKALLLESAVTEFSNKGSAGARVDQIAAAANVNKERIYQYFGKKEALFDAVLAARVTRALSELTINGEGPAAVADYAGRLFDLHVSEPATARLLLWEGLERGAGATIPRARKDLAAGVLNSLQNALPAIGVNAAVELLITLVTLCSAWMALPQLDILFAGDSDTADRAAQRRAHIQRTAALIAEDLLSRNTQP